MKTIIIIVACLIAGFSLTRCTTKTSFDYTLTIAPQANSVTVSGDGIKAASIISKRLENFFGIPQERIKPIVADNQINLTISGIDTSMIGQIKKVITGYDKLEFWETYENSEIIGSLTKVNALILELQNAAGEAGTVKPAGADTLEEFTKQNPLFGILSPRVNEKGEPLPSCLIGLTPGKDTSQVNDYLKMNQIKSFFPSDIKFCWSAFPHEYDRSKTLYELHAIKVTAGNIQAPLDGSEIISAKAVNGSAVSDVKINLTMNSIGARNWARITRENINRCIAVVINGRVRSYPRVMSEISGGNTEITGNFTIEEANDLVNVLKSGELPFQPEIVIERIVKQK